MKKLFISFAILIASYLLAFAQSGPGTPVITKSFNIPSFNSSGSISSTNTFQSIFAANVSRMACTVQNLGTHNMIVFFGPIASAISPSSVTIGPLQSVQCNSGGIVLQDQVSITGTSGDQFYAAQQ